MQKFKVIKQSDLDKHTLELICGIKSIAWPYPIAMQKNWIKENLTRDDLHMLFYDDEELLGYMNLVNVKIILNGKLYHALGIGNVCAKINGVGHGRKLMKYAAAYITGEGKIGLLFCQPKLVNFYNRFDCRLIPNDRIIFTSPESRSFEAMIFNFPETVEELVYSDRIF